MKIIKRRMEVFSFYDKTGMELHFEKMAADGWLLEKLSPLYWQYRKIEPKKIRFSISYYASITDFEPEPTQEQREFNEFCEHSGWKLAASSLQMQVFYNEEADPIPIETDPILELENLHRYAKKTALKTYPLLLMCALLMCITSIGSIIHNPIRYLTNINLSMIVWFVLLFVYSASELLGYFLWRRQAKALAVQGIFAETNGHGCLNRIIMFFMLASLVLYILSLGNTGQQVYLVVCMINLLMVLFIVQSLKELMKKRKIAAYTNKTVSIILSFVLSIVFTACINIFMISGIRNDVFKDSFTEIPFTIGDLTGIDDNEYAYSASSNVSLFMEQLHSTQHLPNGNTGLQLSYTITAVKMPFLYDFCFDKLYEQRIMGHGYTFGTQYEEIEAAPWGANHAFQLNGNMSAEWTYLVCYDKYILQLTAKWGLTDVQMRMIGEKLNATAQ